MNPQPNPAPKELQEIDWQKEARTFFEAIAGVIFTEEDWQWLLDSQPENINAGTEFLKRFAERMFDHATLSIADAFEVSKDKESAENYLRSQGLDPEKIAKEGGEKVRELFAKYGQPAIRADERSRLTSQAGQGWKAFEWVFDDDEIYSLLCGGHSIASIHVSAAHGLIAYSLLDEFEGEDRFFTDVNTAKSFLEKQCLSELTSLRVKEDNVSAWEIEEVRVKESDGTMRDAVIEEIANLFSGTGRSSLPVNLHRVRNEIADKIRSLRTKPEESEGTK